MARGTLMTPHLGTTNLLLGIMAAVALLEVFAVVAACVAGFAVVRRLTMVIGRFEQRYVTPAATRAKSILDDMVGAVTVAKVCLNRVTPLGGGVVAWGLRLGRLWWDRRG
jgi:hypothetical protein